MKYYIHSSLKVVIMKLKRINKTISQWNIVRMIYNLYLYVSFSKVGRRLAEGWQKVGRRLAEGWQVFSLPYFPFLLYYYIFITILDKRK
jgi:hypothetical protein